VSSFRQQYGIRLRTDAHEMPWDEFRDLLAGLGPDTPLGRIVQIRTETDEKVLKTYSPEMRKINMEWQKKRANARAGAELSSFLADMQTAFRAMAK
jgi:hypothetical protein